jgi:signal transduction histidine kinase
VGIAILTVLAFALVQAGVATRRAQALARQQVDFVGAMSHELRTPLTAVRAAGRNLADGVVAGDEAVRRYGVMIETEGRRLSEMVENVMLHARMGSGARAAAPRERVDLRELLSEVATAGPWALSQAPVEIRCDVDEGLPPLQGDRGALRRALVNLVDNAVKHGGARGIAIRARAEPGGVGITVEDRGPGIAPGDEARIFEPFYRASHAGGGAGLGLALVKEVAEAHGGSVRAGRPSGGTGAALTMHLPARGGGEEGR